MSKDEYLITDTPLKALTVFAMPMILGSFFQQIYNIDVYKRQVIELKIAKNKDCLADECYKALQQIEEKKYATKIEQDGFKLSLIHILRRM